MSTAPLRKQKMRFTLFLKPQTPRSVIEFTEEVDANELSLWQNGWIKHGVINQKLPSGEIISCPASVILFISVIPVQEQAPASETPITCSCGWKGTRGMLKHTGSLTHADDWWCCPKCDKDVRTMLDEMKQPKPVGELVCLCGWNGDRNMLTGHAKMPGHRSCPKCGSDLTLHFQALRPKN